MNKTFEKLENLLKKDERFVSQEGKLIRNAVYEASNKMDEKLLMLLMSDEKIKEIFFTKVNNIYVYDKQKFNFVINNRQMLPDSYTRYKQDIGLMNSKDEYISATNDVVLSFPFKDCVLEFDSTDPDQNREEVFFNEILAHDEIDHLFNNKVLTNAKLVDENGEKEITEFDGNSNLLIRGNNLLVMHSLLSRYKGQIKLMYWDILYNTKGDSKNNKGDIVPYNDSFKHSSWLTMMKNRLDVAIRLLKEDGIICLQCDDNEMAYLKVLMDEIFGRENFINNISVNMSNMSGQKINNAIRGKRFPKLKETIFIYAKNKELVKLAIPKIEKEEWDDEYNKIIPEWTIQDYERIEEDTIETLNDRIKDYHIYSLNEYSRKEKINIDEKWKFENSYRIFATKPNAALLKKAKGISFNSEITFINNASGDNKLIITDFNRETATARLELVSALINNSTFLGDNWIDIVTTGGTAQEGGVVLKGGKKPEKLLKRIMEMATSKGELVLDAYFGTGTTGAVAMKMGRKFIGIEQLDSHIELAKTRLLNVINGDETGISKVVDWKGGGSFIYFELMKLNKQYELDIENAKSKQELVDLWQKIYNTGFISCYANNESIYKMIEDPNNTEIDDIKKILIELLDKNQLYVNYEDMNDIDFKVSDKDKKFTESFYNAK